MAVNIPMFQANMPRATGIGREAWSDPGTLIETRISDGAIGFGKAVRQGVDPERTVHVFDGTPGSVIAGVLVDNGLGDRIANQFPNQNRVSVMRRGTIWVNVLEPVIAGQDVVIDNATGDFRPVTTLNPNVTPFPGAKFRTTALVPGLAVLEVNLPQTDAAAQVAAILAQRFAPGTPVNAVAATGTLTFTGATADGEVVNIGGREYEFDTNGTVAAGHILVDVSGGAGAAASVTALVAAINADGQSLVTAADGAGDTVVVTAKTPGTLGSDIDVSTSCANATWGVDVTTLAGGVDGTVGMAGWIRYDANFFYLCLADNDITGANWVRAALEAF